MKASVPTSRRSLSALHLLHRAGQCADELFAQNIGKSDLTPRQYAVLRTVSESEDPSQTDLVHATGIDRSTLADIVRRLVTRGLLQRKRTREDARMYAVRLSAAGRSALASAEPAARLTDERVLQALTAQQRNDLLKSLAKIIEALEAEGANGVEKAPPPKARAGARR